MADNIQKGNVGTRFKLLIVEDGSPVDVSSATTKRVYLKKPSGSVISKDAEFLTDGADGWIYYDTQSGDLDEAGTAWEIQAYVSMTGWTGYSERKGFVVHDNLE